MKEFWDARYNEETFAYGINPNEFFKENIDKLPVGNILLPAEGEGRNAVYAARKGWQVTAFDFSVSAKIKAMKLAEEHGVSIDFKVLDAANFQPEANIKYDVVGLFYAHIPAELRLEFHQKIVQIVKNSGYVIFEAFHKNQLNYLSGGPKDAKMLFSKEELEQEFAGLKFLSIEDKVINLDEGLYHQGQGYVLRMIATKA
ncbi:hypothetical protein Emtol_3137 [Emticicia oligotrophica DSM 17448]|uniref:Methyltransferase domain-containing protein n=1 Tax=Emticicia oligotrophica (strain DSM 17448 / CIP 109782 / MTCC 6937 / GPTSA100-15) TaxID=929562 RepID=A0ABM5N440_EMTOG|nr:class I SAM-dependent methyltransferase [Emticicia oligotrophica]AFK04270.1 hypothetical protein Emtol_3137 [Emticicia oligotrophica DSM 17448]